MLYYTEAGGAVMSSLKRRTQTRVRITCKIYKFHIRVCRMTECRFHKECENELKKLENEKILMGVEL